MTMLHPFMPFITEEIWHQLKDRKDGEDCVISSYPTAQSFDDQLTKDFDKITDVITKVRDIRAKNNVSKTLAVPLFVEKSEGAETLYQREGVKALISKIANLSSFEFVGGGLENTISFLSGTEKYFLKLELEIDEAAQRERLTKELEHAQGFVNSVMKKLSNERFVNNAPAAVVEKERKKLSDGQQKIKILKEGLDKLN